MKSNRAERRRERELFDLWLAGDAGPLAVFLEETRKDAWLGSFGNLPEEIREEAWFRFIHDKILLASIRRVAAKKKRKDPIGWLHLVFRNATIDVARPAKSRPSMLGTDFVREESQPPAGSDPVRAAIERELVERLEQIAQDLDGFERRILEIVRGQILSGETGSLREVSRQMGLIIANLGRSRFRRRLEGLRKKLRKFDREWFGEVRPERSRAVEWSSDVRVEGDGHGR